MKIEWPHDVGIVFDKPNQEMKMHEASGKGVKGTDEMTKG
jgi:hypothetical protein